MKKILLTSVAILSAAILSDNNSIALENPTAPVPRLIKTNPKMWEKDVDTDLKAVAFRFDIPMRPGRGSWLGIKGQTHSLDLRSKTSKDKKTQWIAGPLQRGKVYVFSMNESGNPHAGIQSTEEMALPPTFLVFQTKGKPSFKDAPPQVTKTVPRDGQAKVNPERVRGIAVEFDRPMKIKHHGLMLKENGTDVDLKDAKFDFDEEAKVFYIYYDFKPKSTYQVQLNSDHNIDFVTRYGIPLWPYRFTFRTADPNADS